jgi:hypothetical protein
MSHRRIDGLALAREHEGPACFTAKRRRPRGAKGAGVKFEKEFAKKCGAAGLHGQWFEFHDRGGRGYAQTDVLLFTSEATFVVECKLGNIEAGQAQILELYKPILEFVYRRPAYGIVLARHLTENPIPGHTVASLHDAMRFARSGKIAVLQWRERFPLILPPGLDPSLRYPAQKAQRSA